MQNNDSEYQKFIKEILPLKLTDDVVERALKSHLGYFISYITEVYSIDNLDANVLLQNKELRDTFKDLLLGFIETDTSTQFYFLINLLMANPQLVEKETSYLMEGPDAQTHMRQLQDKLIKTINKNKAKIQAMWKEAAQKSTKQNIQGDKDNPYATMDYYQKRKLFENAVNNGDLKILKLILGRKPLEIENYAIEQAFYSAVYSNKISVVLCLLNKCPEAIRKPSKIEALKAAAHNKNHEMLKLLLDYYGGQLKRFELYQALGSQRAQAILKQREPSKKSWPKVITDFETNAAQENAPPNPNRSKRPLPQAPQKQLQSQKTPSPHTSQDIKRPLPVRPKRKD